MGLAWFDLLFMIKNEKKEIMGDIPYVLPFDAVTEQQASAVGGKGFRLAELARAGLPVLPGFCITTAAYRTFVESDSLLPLLKETDAAAIREHILHKEIPAPIAGVIAEACNTLGGPVAIRSSATAEDLQNASFAGQYATFLNVAGTETILERVRDCWASLWSDQALAYMRGQEVDPREAAMGIVVQRQGHAYASGVIFTLNPLTANEEEMVVEAAWGLGEAVVSGRVTPDRYVVNIIRDEIVSQEIANQSVIMVPDEAGGMREESLPPEKRDTPVLDEGQLRELARLGDEVQVLYGHPQDIEWALIDGRFVLLQARPMTSINFDPGLGQWTSANYREVLPGFACPLTVSLSLEQDFRHALISFLKTIKMGIVPPDTLMTRTFFGRIYWNVGVVKRFNSRVPGFKERHFDATVGIEPTYEGDGLTTPWTPRTILRGLPILFALNDQYKNAWVEAQTFCDHYYAEVEPELRALDVEALSEDELARRCHDMARLHFDGNTLAIVIAFVCEQAQEEFDQIVRRLSRRLPSGEQLTIGDLITGLQDVATAQPPLALQQLARLALQDEELLHAVVDGPPQDIPQRLAGSEAGRAFRAQIDEVVERFHYMAAIDEDLIQPRWDEDPIDALISLQKYVHAGKHFDPEQHLGEQLVKREKAEKLALSALSSGLRKFWPFDRQAFQGKLETVRRYIWWREETRVMMSHVFYHCRRIYKELGWRWAASGILDGPDDVFYLEWPAIRDVLDGAAPAGGLRDQVAAYLRLKARYRHFDPPGVIGPGSSLRRIRRRPVQKRYQGVPCSSGQVEGRARVATTLEEARALQPGEILVARYTNPGWTPLFAIAGGIVIEEGGLLSHGAVVAREYGLPAVLSIEDATRLFETGQFLRVDGSAGTVELIPPPPLRSGGIPPRQR